MGTNEFNIQPPANATVTISWLQISDLFFNHEKPAFDSLHKQDGRTEPPTMEEVEGAALADAKAFIGIIGLNPAYAEELVIDFLKRL